jgi:hypothetical protein
MTRLRLGLGPLQLSPVAPRRAMGPANHPPVVANAIPDQSASEGTAFSFQFATDVFSDPDGDALNYAATLVGGGALPAWLAFTPATRTFAGTPGAGDFADLDIRVMATDPGGLTAHDDFLLAVNGKPVVANAIPDQSASEGTAFSFQFATNVFSDPDGDALSYAATLVSGGALPTWLTFTPATRTFAGTPGAGDFADLNIRVTATDPGGLSAHDDFVLTVNGKPVVANPLVNKNATATLAFSYQFASNSFSDPDGDTLTYAASGMPDWITFTAATRTFAGTPTIYQGGTTTVTVRATDPGGLYVEDSFDVTVLAPPTGSLVRLFANDAGSGPSVIDQTGNANLQLGSTAGSDTNDPSWGSSPARLDFDGVDDYCISSVTTGLVSGNADISMFACYRTTGTSQQVILNQGSSSATPGHNPNLQVVSSTQARFGFGGQNCDVTVTGGTTNKDLFQTARYRASDGAQETKVMTTGDGNTRTATGVSIDNTRVTMGAYVNLTTSFKGRIYLAGVYAKRISDTERAQLYSWAQAVMAARGVTV